MRSGLFFRVIRVFRGYFFPGGGSVRLRTKLHVLDGRGNKIVAFATLLIAACYHMNRAAGGGFRRQTSAFPCSIPREPIVAHGNSRFVWRFPTFRGSMTAWARGFAPFWRR